MSNTAIRFDDLSPKQRILFELLLQEKKNKRNQEVIPRSTTIDVIPLSFAQQRLWFLNQLAPDSPSYNIPLAVQLNGKLNRVALCWNLNEIVQRHDILRTTFVAVDGRPMQRVAARLVLPLSVVDLHALSVHMRKTVTHRLIIEEAQQCFDLAHGPLLRAILLLLDEETHVLLLMLHHIVADGWSLEILCSELSALYNAWGTGKPAHLPELPIQYADYAIWQRTWLQGAVLDAQLSYWRQQLADLPALHLPTDRPHPPTPSFRGALQRLVLPSELNAGLLTLSRQVETTLFMTLLTAFQLLLARYTAQIDIVVGSPIANRTRDEIENLIGCFANTLVLRTNLSGNPTIREVLQRVREVTLAAFEHQDLPFDLLVEALQPERDLNRTPLFQVMFDFQSNARLTKALAGISLHALDLGSETAKFDLTLRICETGHELIGMIEYCTDLFDAATIARMLGHFEVVLLGMAANPDLRFADIQILTAAEHQQLLVDWNATQTAYPRDVCLHELFAAQVKRTPDAVAVVFDRGLGSGVWGQRDTETRRLGDTETEDRGWKIEDGGSRIFHPLSSILHPQSLTYTELNERANRLAHHLRALGVGPEVAVAICMERSVELVVGLLSVLKAGGAYLPLDPAYPEERLAFMLEDAQAPVLLTRRRDWELGKQFHSQSPIANPQSPIAVYLDADWPAIAALPAMPPSAVSAANLAYVIYTSGSTGRPKGAMNTHRAVVNRLCWMQDAYHLIGDDVVLQKTPISFDVAVWEFFWPLLNGARLILARPGGHQDSAYLARLIASECVTTLHFVPPMLQVFLEEPDLARCDTLRRVICSGEALPVELQDRCCARLHVELHNLYGPTEAAVDVTAWACAPAPGQRSVPIGRPIANTQIYLLDGHLQPVPVGVPGELYIGGVQLAPGYHNRPDLTAERFVPNPFGGVLGVGCWVLEDSAPNTQHLTPNTRLYKTGDLARYRPDGAIEFLGRIDQQVKLRGFRIELGEIEAVLNQYPLIQESVVVVREDLPGSKRLVAYVVTSCKSQVTSEGDELLVTRYSLLVTQLRVFLKEKLPDYMVPAAFVPLETLPLTPNGKVDRRALPAPDKSRSELEQPFVAPRSPVEDLLATIWTQVLGVAQVSIHDNFFALGGHSLLATQVIARVRHVFEIDLPLRQLFEAPTIAQLAERLEAVLRDSQGLLAPPIRPVSRDQALPLSFAQQRLWFLDQLEPHRPTYTIPAAVCLTGPLDLSALQQSLSMIVQRHEVLRTTFRLVAGRPVQVIMPATPVLIPLIDLQDIPVEERKDVAVRLASAEARRSFDMTRGPLVWATLLRLAAVEHVLLLTMHHIVSDGWSTNVLVRELTALYTAYIAGQPPSLVELPIQYADYTVWQRNWLLGSDARSQESGVRSQESDVGERQTQNSKLKTQNSPFQAQLAYWRRQLADLPTLDLPTDRPRPPVQTFRGAQQNFALVQSMLAQLRALSKQADGTLFMALLAVFQVLLSRYSGQDDIVVGTPIANRTRDEIEGLIGFFANTLVMRTDLSGNPSFRALLTRVREVCLGAYAHQDLPFEQLVAILQPPRDLSRHPLFQVMFVLQNMPRPSQGPPGLSLSSLPIDSGIVKFDMTLTLLEAEQGLLGALEYNTDLFDAATITRMLGHFQVLLDGIVANPHQPIMQLPLLTDAEREQLLVEWTATAAPYPDERCFHQLVEDQVARAPDAVAVVFDRPTTNDQRPTTNDHHADKETKSPTPNTQHPTPNTQQLTYAELNRRANQLARTLRGAQVGSGVLVGLCVERSVELVIALLGILKAGGAYLPLDPTYPPDRLAFMLADAQVPVLLTQQRLIEGLPQHAAHVICLDADWSAIAAERTDNLNGLVTADDLAYVIYTSGSTGRPKGALLHHRGLCNLAAAQRQTFGLGVDSRVLQFASLSFDASTFEIAMALPVGAALCLATPEQLLPGPGLVQLLREQAISIVTLPPTALAVLPTADLPALRTISVAGEACGGALVARWAGGRRFFNLYGPTEATVWVTAAECSANGQPPTIGRAIANTQIYLLDRGLQVVPIGVPGELHIGGVGLALGYLNRPELTAERFIPNPFGEVLGVGCWVLGTESSNTQHPTPNTRLYRTGDLARYRPDGNIEFLGRIDAQVKVRGFRIELGEIEVVLGQHPAVRESVVVAREDVPGDVRLVAYLLTSDKSQVTSSADSSLVTRYSSLVTELRDFLRERLPSSMIPSAFVLLETLPLTPTGKVDRRALPAPATGRPELEDAYVAPRSPIEELLSQIWAAVLQLDRVGVHDNFFALGGHSLLATQVVAQGREIFQVEVPLRGLFEAPTVAGFAERIAAARQNGPSLLAPPIQPIPRSESLLLSYAQQRLWFLDQLEPHHPVYNIPTALLLTGPLAVTTLAGSLSAIVARHEALRTTFAAEDGHVVQVIAPVQAVRLPLLDLQRLPADTRAAEVSRLAQVEAHRPFDLARGPLLRARLLRLAAEEHVLLLTMHHIVADGWSVNVFCRELAALYAADFHGTPAALPDLPIQYADYAVWQRQWLRGAVLETHLAYWKGQLADLAMLQLPTDHPRPAAMSFQGAHQRIAIPRTVSAGLMTLSRQEGATLFMTLVAAWQALLARYSGQDDVVIGTPIANRTRPEIEGLIGCFVNTLVLRTNLVGNPPFRVLLGRVREVCLDAYAHQEVPFEQVVEAVGSARDLSHHPLFQVMLVLQNAPEATLELPGLTLSSLPAAGTSTRFDLTLSLAEGMDGLAGVLEYSIDLFDAATIARMTEHFQALLAGVVADPARPLADLPLLTDAERRQLLVDWNTTQAAYPHDQCIHELFAAQVAHTPDTVAVVFRGQGSGVRGQGSEVRETRPALSGNEGRQGDKKTRRQGPSPIPARPLRYACPPSPIPQHLTYCELNARANQLAYRLRALGVGPEVCVGLCVERSLELLIGLLGVLKAGGAYVPLDPAYPPHRLAFMLEDAQAPVLITTNDQPLDAARGRRPTTNGVRSHSKIQNPKSKIVHLDADWPMIAGARHTNPGSRMRGSNLAYVIYTSGSTGHPKGVQVTHESVCNLAIAQRRIFAIQPDSRILQVAALSFDVMVSDIFTALLAGATLCLVSSEALLPGPALIRLLDEQQITFTELPASLLAALPVADLPALRTLISGGEPCPAELAARWSAGRQFFNVYGPTEATVATIVAAITAAGRADKRPLPIGRPLANTQVYLLDAQLQPVPIGVPGELHIGGAGLARGYLNRPDLTAERFIPNPFAEVTGVGCWVLEDSAPNTQHPTPNTRLYRTGDRARYRADGNIEFLGRLDQQVKIRGFRIELGEVEAALAQHPGVREAVVAACEDAPGEKRLVAYVVPKIEDRGLKIEDSASDAPEPLSSILDPRSSELRAFLQTKLPDHMIPAAFVLLDALPLTSSGKVDRRALPAPDRRRPELGDILVAPRTHVEEVLAQIWAAVLRLEGVGIHDNFFELGGHSLLATQAVARVRDAFQVEVPLRSLFEAPTIAGLAAHVEAMWRGVSGLRIPPPQPVPRTGPPPLSFAQQRLWFLDQLMPNSPVYNLPAAMRLTGKLDMAAMKRSLGVIVRRHEVLRTTFAMADGQPVQVIAPAQAVLLPLIDLQSLPQDEREAAARRLAATDARRPFDLARGPLLRVTVLHLEAQEHVVLLNMHHIVADGWSMGIFIQELTALYNTGATGQPASLPELPIQYADFAIWQRNWLQGGQGSGVRGQGSGDVDLALSQFPIPNPQSPLQVQLAYWRHQLADLPALQLPTDHPRPPVPSFQGANWSFVLPRALYDQLLTLSRAEGVTLFMTTLAGWQALLARYSQQHDIAVGTDVANRTRAEIEELIGFFVNQLVLRTDVSGNPPFKTLLRQVREVALGAYAHQDLPFEQVVKELNPERNLAYEPLFQVKFILQNAPLAAPAMADLTLRPFGNSEPMARFDLVLSLTESMDGLAGMLVYRTDLLDAVTIARMADHFQTLLEGIVTQPMQRLADLPILTAAERQQLLVDWNATARDYPQDACLHHLFAVQAARSPDAVAVVFDGPGARGQGDTETRRHGDKETRFSVGSQHPTPNTQHPTPNTQHLTYAELNARANQLAHYLRSLGVGPEVRVGLCVERSLDLLIGLLGVLKAGGAYVPLDPTYPQDRLAFMIADSQVPVLLTQTRLIDMLPSSWAHLIYLDGDWTIIARECVENPAGAVRADNLAYVIYTSGSTGTPKGTLVAHRGLCNVAEAQRATFATHPNSHILQFATLSFDAAIFELMLALPAGATLCLAPASALLPGPQLIRLLRDLAVTHLTLPPSALAALPHAPLPDLRTINVAGEACPASLAARWGAGRRFWNLYGPTEATIWTTAMECGTQAAPPIGRPIANTQVYLLDAQLQPVPVSVPGEIHIGGVGLARGYLNRPDLTAERFVPNLFAEVLGDGCWVMGAESSNTQHPTPNTRLYKTGDLARYHPDGNLEFLGRIDQQVKLRGFRIELGEVEAALASHPDVQEAVVVVREDAPGDRRLVAYVVTSDKLQVTSGEDSSLVTRHSSLVTVLRGFLTERLPAYMIPAAFVTLEALPLTPSGKVDRQGLPAPDRVRPALDNAFAVPQTPVEERLARIWAEVLGVEQVGIHDNFFALGGDSILGIQMIARAHRAGLHLTPGQLFQHQTVAALAAAVQTTTATSAAQGIVAGLVPLTPIQHWFFEQNLPTPQHYNQALLLEVRQSLVPLLLERATQHLLAHHDALRLRFVRDASGWQQRHADVVAPLPCTWVDLSGLPLSEHGGAIETAAATAQASLDLAVGPLMRMIFFDCGAAQPGRLLLIIHHLIVDGVSWRVLLEDLQTAYGQLSRGEAVALPPKTTSFQRWAERLVAYAQSDALQEELAYWLRAAHRGNARLLLDHTGGANTMASARHLTVALGVDETRVLLQEVPSVYQTHINDVLLTALAQTLAQWTGQRALLIDLEGHGREDLFADVDLTRTVGWCTTLFPVLLDLELAHGPGPALKAIKEQLRQVPHHGIGYGVLRYLSADAVAAQLRALPQAEVSFNYLGQVDQLVAEAALFGPARESSGSAQSADGMRSHLLEINGVIAGGQLRMEWSYSEQLHDHPTIERLAQDYLAALRTLITHCQSSMDVGYTPSDFPDVSFDQNKLDDLIAKIYETLEDEE